MSSNSCQKKHYPLLIQDKGGGMLFCAEIGSTEYKQSKKVRPNALQNWNLLEPKMATHYSLQIRKNGSLKTTKKRFCTKMRLPGLVLIQCFGTFFWMIVVFKCFGNCPFPCCDDHFPCPDSALLRSLYVNKSRASNHWRPLLRHCSKLIWGWVY